MEEQIPVRYTFLMLLAIADVKGRVIGTDVALARRLNMSLEEFQDCIGKLQEPDPNSNSPAEEGKRVIASEGERGYQLVNYEFYRSIRSEEERREYMRNYMAHYREKKKVEEKQAAYGNGHKRGDRALNC